MMKRGRKPTEMIDRERERSPCEACLWGVKRRREGEKEGGEGVRVSGARTQEFGGVDDWK